MKENIIRLRCEGPGCDAAEDSFPDRIGDWFQGSASDWWTLSGVGLRMSTETWHFCSINCLILFFKDMENKKDAEENQR